MKQYLVRGRSASGLLASQCAETAATRLLKLGSVEVAAKDKDLVQRLEASLIHWTRQIKELTTQQDSTHEDEGAGPLEEIEFWRARDVDLSRLYIHDDLFFTTHGNFTNFCFWYVNIQRFAEDVLSTIRIVSLSTVKARIFNVVPSPLCTTAEAEEMLIESLARALFSLGHVCTCTFVLRNKVQPAKEP